MRVRLTIAGLARWASWLEAKAACAAHHDILTDELLHRLQACNELGEPFIYEIGPQDSASGMPETILFGENDIEVRPMH